MYLANLKAELEVKHVERAGLPHSELPSGSASFLHKAITEIMNV